jgi:2-oxoglutarate ferredoxin oxidoreductase subunit delta
MAKRTGKVEILVQKCKGCGLCVASCPTHSLKLSEDLNRQGYHPAEFLEGTGCTGCGVCYYACPEPDAITVYLVTEDAVA